MAVVVERAQTSDGVLGLFSRLLENLRADGYRGYEFDDFLASPVLNGIGRRNLLAARVLIQAGERLPVNLRPVLGRPSDHEHQGDGLLRQGSPAGGPGHGR